VVDLILDFFRLYLIEIMAFFLVTGLMFRWLTYRHSKIDRGYFGTFTREIENCISIDSEDGVKIEDKETYLAELLGRVGKRLPNRSLRHASSKHRTEDKKRDLVSLRDFVSSKDGMISSIQAESNVFNNKTPPNFTELTDRIMGQDNHWSKLMGYIPIDGVSRMIDILPNLFIIFGVFGTFIGIAKALPMIANIDFNDLAASQATLTTFVLDVTFAMKTSIAGIFFSLILTFLNTLFPLKEVRSKIFKNVENCFQVLWYHIQREGAVEKRPEVLMEEMVSYLKLMSEKLSKQASGGCGAHGKEGHSCNIDFGKKKTG
jgi:hypothetical protein